MPLILPGQPWKVTWMMFGDLSSVPSKCPHHKTTTLNFRWLIISALLKLRLESVRGLYYPPFLWGWSSQVKVEVNNRAGRHWLCQRAASSAPEQRACSSEMLFVQTEESPRMLQGRRELKQHLRSNNHLLIIQGLFMFNLGTKISLKID